MGCRPHGFFLEWDAPWAAVVAKAREHWEVMVSAGTPELDARLM